MKLISSSTIKPGNWAALEAKLVPKLVQAATNGAKAVLAISQGLVHVRSGELKASGGIKVEWVGQKIVGYVVYTAPWAAFNEFGTGRRGSASPWRGDYPYKEDWPGMVPIPYLRPALDQGRQQTVEAFRSALGV